MIHVIPDELAAADWQTRVDWLVKDSEGDDRMLGVPRYESRYTSREAEILSYLRLSQESAFAQIIRWIEEMDDDDALGRVGLRTTQEVIAYLQGRRRGAKP